MSNNPNLDRSKRHERQIVRAAEDAGLQAERAWNSNGQSLGEHEACDVRLETLGGTTWTVQAKRRKTVANYLTEANADVVVARQDRGENLVVVRLDRFLSLLKETGDPLNELLDEMEEESALSELLDELDSGDDLNELLEDLNGGDDLSNLLSELESEGLTPGA